MDKQVIYMHGMIQKARAEGFLALAEAMEIFLADYMRGET